MSFFIVMACAWNYGVGSYVVEAAVQEVLAAVQDEPDQVIIDVEDNISITGTKPYEGIYDNLNEGETLQYGFIINDKMKHVLEEAAVGNVVA